MSRPKTGEKMVKISSYFSARERDNIDNYREDMSRSLFIRRAVRKAINDDGDINNDNNNNEMSSVGGGRATNHTPATAVEAVTATTRTTTTQQKNQEVEVL